MKSLLLFALSNVLAGGDRDIVVSVASDPLTDRASLDPKARQDQLDTFRLNYGTLDGKAKYKLLEEAEKHQDSVAFAYFDAVDSTGLSQPFYRDVSFKTIKELSGTSATGVEKASCRPGQEWSIYLKKCVCVDTFSIISEGHCVPCSEGQQPMNERACENCRPGYYNPLKGSRCVKCPKDTYAAQEASTSCLSCVNGDTFEGTKCVCPQDAPWFEPTQGCEKLSPSAYLDSRVVVPPSDRSDADDKCGSDQFYDISLKLCVCNDPNKVVQTGGVCAGCGQGKQPGSPDRCQLCPIGTANNFESGRCLLCHPNTFADDTGFHFCLLCGKNGHAEGLGNKQCECNSPAYERDEVTGICDPIPGYFYPADTNCPGNLVRIDGLCRCTEGFIMDPQDPEKCVCPSGKELAVTTDQGVVQSGCQACPMGSYNPVPGWKCMPCAHLHYSTEIGMPFCFQCEIGTNKTWTEEQWAASSRTKCPCEQGYHTFAKETGQCTRCWGKWATAGLYHGGCLAETLDGHVVPTITVIGASGHISDKEFNAVASEGSGLSSNSDVSIGSIDPKQGIPRKVFSEKDVKVEVVA